MHRMGNVKCFSSVTRCDHYTAMTQSSLLLKPRSPVAGQFMSITELPAVSVREAQSAERRKSSRALSPPPCSVRTAPSLAAVPASSTPAS
jgi:hypothetical protein